MVGWIVQKADFQARSLAEFHHSVYELGSAARIVRTVVEIYHKLLDMRISRRVRIPPLFNAIHYEIAGFEGRAENQYFIFIDGASFG